MATKASSMSRSPKLKARRPRLGVVANWMSDHQGRLVHSSVRTWICDRPSIWPISCWHGRKMNQTNFVSGSDLSFLRRHLADSSGYFTPSYSPCNATSSVTSPRWASPKGPKSAIDQSHHSQHHGQNHLLGTTATRRVESRDIGLSLSLSLSLSQRAHDGGR